jgi:NAD(P)-dependent dehydrogenase (short-subunit alcohol dehydrogenase family)
MGVDLGLSGKVALVTGGSKGIGRACAERLAAEGCDVMLVARTEADLRDAATAIGAARGRRIEICATDLRSAQGCEAAVGALKHAFGRLDILVNNAGATQSGDFFALEDEVWQDGFALKFYAGVRMSRALWPLLKEARGALINVIGGASKTPSANFMIGGAVNAAVTSVTKALAELGLRDGVTVNAVHPGMTVTGRLDTLLDQRAAAANLSREAFEQQELAHSGLRRYGQPMDVANLVTYLASPIADHIHGADLFVDGGATKTIL